MLFKKSPEKFWNLIASRYAASPINDQQAYDNKIAQLKTYLKPDYKILDIGCGSGTQCMDLAAYVTHVTGVDLSTKLLDIAQQRKTERKIDNVEFVQASLVDMDFPGGQFDVVTSFYVLHFCQDVEGLFQRIHGWLKPGGLLIIETSCLGERSKFMVKVLRLAGHLGLMPLINPLTYRQLEQALANVGFALIDKTRFSDNIHGEYTLVARKYAQ